MEGEKVFVLALRFLCQGQFLYLRAQHGRPVQDSTGGRMTPTQNGGDRLVNSFVRVLLKLNDIAFDEANFRSFSRWASALQTLDAFANPLNVGVSQLSR